jgi:hypothetical protein
MQCPSLPPLPYHYLRGSNRLYQKTGRLVMEIWKKFCSVLIIHKSHFGQGDELRLTSHFSLVVDAFINKHSSSFSHLFFLLTHSFQVLVRCNKLM